MSFGLRVDGIHGFLVLILTVIFFVAVFYSNIELSYKIVISVVAIGMILLAGLFNQAMNQGT